MLFIKRSEREMVAITVPPSDKPTTIIHFTGGVDRGASGATVYQGFTAPAGVVINRREIQDAIDAGEDVIEELTDSELQHALHGLPHPKQPPKPIADGNQRDGYGGSGLTVMDM